METPMAGQSSDDLLAMFDGAPLNRRYWTSFSLLSAITVLDFFGRKLQIVTGTFICAVSAALIGVLPTGAWVLLTLLRILVGFGLAAAVTPCLTIVVELTPTRWRTGM